ncbi:hypothetical protein [Fangia hongkongensis]|uniref:hypothetical protein n=1 Tax=Fangia hongkongensis TaxID=270495 RepID=UPI0003714090|nr:hypothetical protein [Fangia hongkongensis]MBK2124011.1 hypothetical protein [Fangia hongkongensis]
MVFKKLTPYILSSLSLITLLSVSGCGQAIIAEQNHKINNNLQAIHTAKENLIPKEQSNIAIVSKAYTGLEAIPMEPLWMHKNLEIHGTLTFQQIINIIERNTPIQMVFAQDISLDMPLKVNFSGSISQVLKYLEIKTNYHYSINDQRILWQKYITQRFQIDNLPGNNNFSLGSDAAGTTSDSNTSSDNSSKNTAKQQGSTSIWKDISQSMPDLLSTHGKFKVSQATSSVTVTDTWRHIEKVKQWIDSINKNMSREVSIKVQIVTVHLYDKFSSGINWNMITKAISLNYGADLFTNMSTSMLNSVGHTLVGKINTGFLSGSSFIIDQLRTQGEVSVVNKPLITTLNNEVSEIQQIKQTSYVKSQSVTIFPANGDNASESSINPGQVTTGLKLFVLPKIDQGKIYLQISVSLSSLDSLKQVQTGNGDNDSSVQLPNVSIKSFNQKSLLLNGQTLVISGFDNTTRQTNTVKHFNTLALGGNAALSDREETVLLISPHIIN